MTVMGPTSLNVPTGDDNRRSSILSAGLSNFVESFRHNSIRQNSIRKNNIDQKTNASMTHLPQFNEQDTNIVAKLSNVENVSINPDVNASLKREVKTLNEKIKNLDFQ